MTPNKLAEELRAAACHNQADTYINTLMRKAAAALIDQAKSAPAEPVSREAVDIVGVVVLGGMFHGGSGPELGDIDIELNPDVLERIQQEVVTSSDDVMLPLMTVNQHNRMMAATPSPDAELVELLRDASFAIGSMLTNGEWYSPEELKHRIDAKLASLK